MRRLVFLAALLVTAPARAEPKVVRFACTIGDGRTRILPRAREEDLDDEMRCQVSLRDLGGRSARDLVAEISLQPPSGASRVGASGHLAPAGHDGAELPALLLPAATWISAVDWRARPPRVRLVLRIYDKPSPGQKRWRLVASSPFEIGRRKR